jgi:hypothetical protein
MGDGMSGLSLSEMGIAVKKAGKQIQKAGSGVVQQAKQQVTGQAPNQTPVAKPEPIFETDDSGNPLSFFKAAAKQVAGASQQNQQQQQPQKQDLVFNTDDTGDPVGLFQGAAKQVTGSGNSQQKPSQQGTFVMPKPPSAVPPSEMAPKQGGGFDIASLFGEQQQVSAPAQATLGQDAALHQQFAQEDAEKEQRIEKLRKQLHQIYYDEFAKKAEGKDGKKEETIQEKLDREKQEEEEKKMKELEEKKKKEQLPMTVKGRQGAHEGLKKQG